MRVYMVYWPEYEGMDVQAFFTTVELCEVYIKRIVKSNPGYRGLRWKEYVVHDSLPFSGISLDG